MCFKAIRQKNNQNENLLEKNNYFPREGDGGGYPSMENSMKIINNFFEAFPYWVYVSGVSEHSKNVTTKTVCYRYNTFMMINYRGKKK